jgi:hypothetical protein
MENKENIIHEEINLKKTKNQIDIIHEKDRKFGTDVTNLHLNANNLIDHDKREFEINLNGIINQKPSYMNTMESDVKNFPKNNVI